MANVLTSLIRNLNLSFMEILQEQAAILPLVDADTGTAPAAVGQTVRTPITPVLTSSAYTPAMIPTLAAGETVGYADVLITNQDKVAFQISGDDMIALEEPTTTVGFIPNSVIEAVRALRVVLANRAMTAMVLGATAAVGASGSDPFTPPTAIAALLPNMALLGQYMNDSLCPAADRNMIATTSAYAQLQTNPLLIKVNESGDNEVLRNGIVGRLQGFGIGYDQLSVYPAIGTGTGYLLSVATAVGDTQITVGTGTGTIIAGDLISIAGDPSIYIAKTALAAGVVTLVVGTRAGYKNSGYINKVNAIGQAVTVMGVGSRMPIFHKTAMKRIVRPTAMPPDGDLAVMSNTFIDQASGCAMRLAYYKGYGVNQWEVQAASGFAVLRPELIKLAVGL